MTTDTSKRGLERLICTARAGHPGERDPRIGTVMKVLGAREVRLTVAPKAA